MYTSEQTLQALAELDPDYQAFIAQLPDEIAKSTDSLPDGLAYDVLNLLRAERPELSAWFDMQSTGQLPSKSVVGTVMGVGSVLGAIVFLLRSHIKFEGSKFYFEHEPAENSLIEKVLDIISTVIGVK